MCKYAWPSSICFLSWKHILVRSDNISTVHHVNQGGSPVSPCRRLSGSFSVHWATSVPQLLGLLPLTLPAYIVNMAAPHPVATMVMFDPLVGNSGTVSIDSSWPCWYVSSRYYTPSLEVIQNLKNFSNICYSGFVKWDRHSLWMHSFDLECGFIQNSFLHLDSVELLNMFVGYWLKHINAYQKDHNFCSQFSI